jgi:hypothetical protein
MTASNISRRGALGALAAAGSVAMTTTAAAIGPDPIIAMIATHKKLMADWSSLYDQLQEAEYDAAQEHGHRPIELIHWRNYTIGASEIETRRAELLEAGEIDTAIIEQEYLDANARYQAKIAAGIAWDNSTGLTPLRNEVDALLAKEHQCAQRLARTKPTTPGGAGAMIQYVLNDYLCADEGYWHTTALKTAADALKDMFGTNILADD